MHNIKNLLKNPKKFQSQNQNQLLILVDNGTAELDFTFGFNSENFMTPMFWARNSPLMMKISEDLSDTFSET